MWREGESRPSPEACDNACQVWREGESKRSPKHAQYACQVRRGDALSINHNAAQGRERGDTIITRSRMTSHHCFHFCSRTAFFGVCSSLLCKIVSSTSGRGCKVLLINFFQRRVSYEFDQFKARFIIVASCVRFSNLAFFQYLSLKIHDPPCSLLISPELGDVSKGRTRFLLLFVSM